jgi:hypothetical protein
VLESRGNIDEAEQATPTRSILPGPDPIGGRGRPAVSTPLHDPTELLDAVGRSVGVGVWSFDLDSGDLYWSEQTRRIHEVPDDFVPTLESFDMLSREAIGDDEISGQKVPAGSYITIASWLLHRHEKYWEQPKAFRPERFLPPEIQKVQQFAYIPFGAGSRVCMGKHLGLLEATLLFAQVAQSFRLRIPEGVVIEPLGRMTLRPTPGMRLRLERRG